MASRVTASAQLVGDYKVPAVERAFLLLQVLAERGPLTLAEIVEAMGINKSTAYYLARTLTVLDALAYDESTRCYSLGSALVSLGATASTQNNSLALAKRTLAVLPDQYNVTVLLYRRVDVGHVVIVDKLERSSSVRITVQSGAPLPIQGASFGRAFLAYDDAKVVNQALHKGLHQFTAKSISDVGEFREQLKTVRERGWALDEEGFALGVSTVAAPIFDQDGQVVMVAAAVGFTSLLRGRTAEECGRKLRQLCDQIGAALGARSPGAQAIAAHH